MYVSQSPVVGDEEYMLPLYFVNVRVHQNHLLHRPGGDVLVRRGGEVGGRTRMNAATRIDVMVPSRNGPPEGGPYFFFTIFLTDRLAGLAT